MYKVIFLLATLTSVLAQKWDYDEIYKWADNFELCNSSHRQSPMGIITANVTYMLPLEPITITVEGTSDNTVTVANNGHTMVVTPPSSAKFFVNFQPGENRFQVVQFHFHWGTSIHGSEHSVNGQFFANELHIVTVDTAHYNATDSNVASYPNSLAVYGWLYEFIDSNNNAVRNTALDKLLTTVSSIKNPNTQTTLSGFNWLDLLPSAPAEQYFRYQGSLTTPPCTENVMWTLVLNPKLPLTTDQLATFRTLNDVNNKPLTTNFRPIQETNNEIVNRSDIVFRIVFGSYTTEQKRLMAINHGNGLDNYPYLVAMLHAAVLYVIM